MSTVLVPTPAALPVPVLQVRFLSILPGIELHGRIVFRHVRCADSRADAVAEDVALAWKWHLGLAERGKDATQFPATLATFAARAVRAGRRVCVAGSGRATCCRRWPSDNTSSWSSGCPMVARSLATR
jgi:hypothetical protein